MKILISDTSVLLNLVAADCLSSLSQATGWQSAVCSAVFNETKKLRDASTGEMVLIELEPMVEAGLLRVMDIDNSDERVIYIDQAAVVDDGEAMSMAIAVYRNFELAIDDRQATNHSKRTFPDLRIWSTPEILKTWAESINLPAGTLGVAIRNIEDRARYFPAKSHPLWMWWNEAKRSSHK
jgi:predicted nucleic acid-binding protein